MWTQKRESSLYIVIDNIIKKCVHTGVTRDVNGAGRVRVVVPPYPTRWINICPVPISVGYPLCGYPTIFFISAGIHEYPRVFTKLFKKQIFNHKFK